MKEMLKKFPRKISSPVLASIIVAAIVIPFTIGVITLGAVRTVALAFLVGIIAVLWVAVWAILELTRRN